MARGGFCKLPNGTVVVALTLPAPLPDRTADGTCTDTERAAPATVRVLVHAVNRARALTRLRNLGLRSVYLRGNTHPPTPDEVTAVLHHPDGLIWRSAPLLDGELWHPIRSLFRATGAVLPGADGTPGTTPGSGPGPGRSAAAARFVPKPLTVPEAWLASGA